MFDDGFFGDLFDFDGDGRLDDFELAADSFAMFNLMEEDEEDDISDFPECDEEPDFEFDED